MKRIAWCLVLAACVHDTYRCEVDTDCNLGDGGRCEADHYCTRFDTSCLLTQRSYEHADALSGTCFVGEATPLNYCAAGQPPAVPVGCAADVCARLPVCCTTGWSEACVLEAQQQCFPDVRCNTRVSVAATHTMVVEIFDASWDGTQWIGVGHSELANTATFLAPIPGTTEPRLAGFVNASQLVIEDSAGSKLVSVGLGRDYHDLVSLDFDRDLRDTLLLDYQDLETGTQNVQVMKLDNGESRDVPSGVSNRMAWGSIADSTGFVDGYPDGVAGNNSNTFKEAYAVLTNGESNQSKYRSVDTGVASSFDSNNTNNGGLALHSFTWADVDGDGLLDLVAFGNSVRVHTGTITDTPFVDLDCNPPIPAGQCSDTGVAAYNGTVLPGPGGARVLAAPVDYPASAASRVIYSIAIKPDHTFSYETLQPTGGPCTTCAFEAVIVRDLDGDGHPDILAIDTTLTFYTALSKTDSSLRTFEASRPLLSFQQNQSGYNTVRTSVTGVPP